MYPRSTSARLMIAALATGSVVLAGCSSSDGSVGAGDNKQVSADADIEGAKAQLAEYSKPFNWKEPGPAFDASSAKGNKVVYIPVDNKIPIFELLWGELENALVTAGVEASLCDGKGSPDQWTACIDDAAGRGADVIIIDSFPVASVKEAIKRARAKGIKIIDGNNGDPGFVPDGADARVAEQYSLSGKLVSDWITVDSGGSANVLIIQSPEVGNVPDIVDKGYVAELNEKCPSCKVTVVDVAVSDWATKLQSTVQGQLAGDPSIDYVIPIFDGMSTYVVPGIRAAGAKDRVKVATFNANLDPMKKMAAGESIFVDVGAHSPYQGWAYADQALRLMTGQEPVADEFVPARVFTRDDVKGLELTREAELSGVWFGPNDYQQKYKALWGLN